MNQIFAVTTRPAHMKRIGLVGLCLLLLSIILTIYTARPVDAAACSAPATDYGRATTSVNVSNSSTYRIWSRIQASSANDNSYLLEVDGNTCFVVGDNALPVNSWTWVDYQNGNPGSKAQLNLAAGNHAIKMIGREAGVRLGRVLFVSNLNCVPVGNGDNCASTTSTDTVPPTVDITAPAGGAVVKDTVNVTASANDNTGLAKVEFYVNGVLRATDTTAPYVYAWDTKVTANGKINLTVKAYDLSGNVNSDSIQVIVAGGDTQAPTAPSNVTAVADPTNKVVVKWSPSTDNIGIAGYRIIRNKITVGQVNSVTEYVDTAVLPDTAYTYQVSAYDLANNSSGLSNAVEVKTVKQTDTEAPSVPSEVKAKAISTSQINVAWIASKDNIAVASYDVYRATGRAAATRIATVTNTSFGDTGLAEKTKYSYYVIAKDKSNNASAKSSIASAETHATPPKLTNGALKGVVTFTKNSENHAHVTLRVKGAKRVFDTDQNGSYSIIGLPAGSYKVMYQAKGSYSKEVTVKIEAGKIKTHDVTLLKR